MKKRYIIGFLMAITFLGWYSISWHNVSAMEADIGADIDVRGESEGSEFEWPSEQSPEIIEQQILEQEQAEREAGQEPTAVDIADAQATLQELPQDPTEIITAMQTSIGTVEFEVEAQKLEDYYSAKATLMTDAELTQAAQSLAEKLQPASSETDEDISGEDQADSQKDEQDDMDEEESEVRPLEEATADATQKTGLEGKTLRQIKLQALKDQSVMRNAVGYDEVHARWLAEQILASLPNEETLIDELKNASVTEYNALASQYYYYWLARATLLSDVLLADLIIITQQQVAQEAGGALGG